MGAMCTTGKFKHIWDGKIQILLNERNPMFNLRCTISHNVPVFLQAIKMRKLLTDFTTFLDNIRQEDEFNLDSHHMFPTTSEKQVVPDTP